MHKGRRRLLLCFTLDVRAAYRNNLGHVIDPLADTTDGLDRYCAELFRRVENGLRAGSSLRRAKQSALPVILDD